MEVGKLKMRIAIGCYGGAIAVEVIEANEQIAGDLKEFGGCLEDFFHGGDDLPKESGLYVFDGIGHATTDENGRVDDAWYVGSFARDSSFGRLEKLDGLLREADGGDAEDALVMMLSMLELTNE